MHRFLKEEGFNRKFLAYDLGIALPTVDDYLNDPTKFKVKHIKAIAEEAEVDFNFIFDLIYNVCNKPICLLTLHAGSLWFSFGFLVTLMYSESSFQNNLIY